MMNVVAPFGFYGWGNIGDESTLQGFARLVSRYHPQMRVWIASRDPSHTARVEPSFKYYKAVGRDLRKRWVYYRSAACVVPGGTPIMDVLGAWPLSEVAPLVQAVHAQGKPVVFIGTGTESLLREESKRIVSNILATSVQHWTVRCQRDKERLTEYGVLPERITVTADLAWNLASVPNDFGRECLAHWGLDLEQPFIGVNVNNERFVLQQEPRLCEKMGIFLDKVVEKNGASILFFCNEVREGESFDRAANLKVLNYMSHRDKAFLVPNRYWTPQQMLSLIGCCQITVGIRYHFCLFSILQGVPFIALQRSDKVADLCWDMNWPYGISLKNLNGSVLLDMISDIDQKKPSLLKSLRPQIEFMRERAGRNSLALDALARQVECAA
jgi:polysaccharide pyruvyl transferase WcaK-like protein